MQGGIPAVLIYEDLETLSPYMHTENDVVGRSLNAPDLFEANARLATAAIATLADPLGMSFVRGDVNEDSELDLSDAVSLLIFLFQDDSIINCFDAADANDDGAVDIADAVRVLSHLFAGGADLPEPFDGCGMDPSADDLDCASYPPCGTP